MAIQAGVQCVSRSEQRIGAPIESRSATFGGGEALVWRLGSYTTATNGIIAIHQGPPTRRRRASRGSNWWCRPRGRRPNDNGRHPSFAPAVPSSAKKPASGRHGLESPLDQPGPPPVLSTWLTKEFRPLVSISAGAARAGPEANSAPPVLCTACSAPAKIAVSSAAHSVS